MARGVCASGDPVSAQAGADVLAAGGNAVDAVIAASLMTGFTLPTMAGVGGGMLATYAIDGDVGVVDGFAAMPGLGRGDSDVRPVEVVIDFEGIPLQFQIGAASVAVPGKCAGLWALHERHGRMPMAEVAAPTIEAARNGVAATNAQHDAIVLLQQILRYSDEAWETVSEDDLPLRVGRPLINPKLADTMEALVAEGPRLLYEGDLGAGITDVTQGFITREDLAAFRPQFAKPLEGSYRGWKLWAPAAPSLSGAMLLAAFAHLERVGPLSRELTPKDWMCVADALHACERARTDEYEQRLFEDGFLESYVERVAQSGSTKWGSTVHCCAADADGNVAGATSTVGESAGLTIPGTGVLLNNFLGEDDIVSPTAPRAPGERMFTSVCPTLLSDGADRRISLGAAGSKRIRSAILQSIVHLVDGGASPAEAVAHPRIHVEDGRLYVEGHGRTRERVEELVSLAGDADVTWDPGFFFGGVQAVERDGDTFRGGGDTARRGGVAVVL